jgi:curved DNA-binding protein CbpA
MLAGLVELESQRRERDVASVGAVTRVEVEARLEKAKDADHYRILELNPTAEFDEIREAYYFLARRYHPDRFRAGAMQDLLQPMERYFTQVTEAYNTLIDSEARAGFDKLREAAHAPARESEQDTRYLAKQNAIAARAFIDKGRFTDAAKYLENAIQLDGTVATYHLELGQLLSGNPRRRADAEEHLLEANRLDPALADGYLALGQLYLKMQRVPQAAKMFREVLRWEPGHIEATRLIKALADGEDATDDGGLLRGLFRS